MGEGVPLDVRLPPREDAEDFFMEDLFVDTEDELPALESPATEVSEGELYPNFTAENWIPESTPTDRHISDSSRTDFEDPLDNILRKTTPWTDSPFGFR